MVVMVGWKNVEPDPIGERGCGRPKKTRIEVIYLDRLALGLTETHFPIKN